MLSSEVSVGVLLMPRSLIRFTNKNANFMLPPWGGGLKIIRSLLSTLNIYFRIPKLYSIDKTFFLSAS